MVFAGTACNTASPLRGDGDGTKFDFVGPSSSNYYQFSASMGRSYSVQVTSVYDDVNTDITATAWTDTGCSVALAGTVNTVNANPGLPANSTRFSFTAAANGTVYLKVTNANGATGRYVDISAEETSLYNPRWTTTQGYLTVYGVQNTTNQIAHVSMVATIDFNGSSFGNFGTVTLNLTLQPNQRQLVALAPGQSINIPAGEGGYLVITDDVPKGGIVADAYFANNVSLVPAVVTTAR